MVSHSAAIYIRGYIHKLACIYINIAYEGSCNQTRVSSHIRIPTGIVSTSLVDLLLHVIISMCCMNIAYVRYIYAISKTEGEKRRVNRDYESTCLAVLTIASAAL